MDERAHGVRPTPLSIVTADDPGDARRLVDAWRGTAGGAAWALLAAPDRLSAGPGLEAFTLPQACPCCAGAIALRGALTRVLRGRAPARIVLAPAPEVELPRLVDTLRTPPLAQYLQIEHLIDVPAGGPGRPDPLPRPGAAVAWLDDRLDDGRAGGHVGAGGAPDPASGRASHPWRWQRGGTDPSAHWPDVDGRARFDAVLDVPLAPVPRTARRLEHRWPGDRIFDRRATMAGLQRLAGCLEVLHLRFIGRTGREWYHWTTDAPPGNAGVRLSAAGHDGAELAQTGTHWRLDSRLEVWLAADAVGAAREHAAGGSVDPAIDEASAMIARIAPLPD